MPTLSEINDKPKEFMEAIHRFGTNPRGFFVISGTNGNGKTFVARAIFEYFSLRCLDNHFWNLADLKIKWQELLAEFKTASFLLQEITKAPLLVLDDLGTTKPSEAFMEFLYIVADKRYESRNTCGTIITTNLNSKSMREMFGDAFVSRVASGICVRHDGPDRRFNNF